jgi:hypothetical protein
MEPPKFLGLRPARQTENATGLTVNSLTSSTLPLSIMDEDRSRRAPSVLSMDDLEAAQALEGLRSGMWFRMSYIPNPPKLSPKKALAGFGWLCDGLSTDSDLQISDNLLEYRDNHFPSLRQTHHHQSHYCLC